MIIHIGRINDDGYRVQIATFNDLWHSALYIKAHLDKLNELKQDGELVITYKHERED